MNKKANVEELCRDIFARISEPVKKHLLKIGNRHAKGYQGRGVIGE